MSKEYKCMDCGCVNAEHNMICEGDWEKGEYLICPDCMSRNVEDWAFVPETNKYYVVFERPIGSEVFTMSTRECFNKIYHKHESAKSAVDRLLKENHGVEFAIFVCRMATVHKYSVCGVS